MHHNSERPHGHTPLPSGPLISTSWACEFRHLGQHIKNARKSFDRQSIKGTESSARNEIKPKTMPRILNRPPVFPKPRDKVSSFLITTSSTKGSSSVRSSSGLSRSERSELLSHGGGGGGITTSSIRSVRSDYSQLTFDTSMSNAAYDGASGRVQNNDWGHFVDFYDPDSRDDDAGSFSLWRS